MMLTILGRFREIAKIFQRMTTMVSMPRAIKHVSMSRMWRWLPAGFFPHFRRSRPFKIGGKKAGRDNYLPGDGALDASFGSGKTYSILIY
ncbi:hypothetical protein N182_29235 [Sinorhizobium sp. GL2]|nr:hypothetical protein N182_29235 [Sinorhizobium sp. GL2]